MSTEEPRIVYVERQKSAWSGFTPGRVFAVIAIAAFIVFAVYAQNSSQRSAEQYQQAVEQAEYDGKQAQRDLVKEFSKQQSGRY